MDTELVSLVRGTPGAVLGDVTRHNGALALGKHLGVLDTASVVTHPVDDGDVVPLLAIEEGDVIHLVAIGVTTH